MSWRLAQRAPDAPEPDRPWVVTNGHFRVFFRSIVTAAGYTAFQNIKEGES